MTVENIINQYRNIKDVYIITFDDNGSLMVGKYNKEEWNKNIKNYEVKDYEQREDWLEIWV